jgi:hypothetical protein
MYVEERAEIKSGCTCKMTSGNPETELSASVSEGGTTSYLAPTSPVLNMRMRRVACV